ncbi:MAG: 4a-hydroxytetrahydrobiopterin dehydratase [Deltaproteobacteria bacterium]|nr:4a-hydroxytetrahydrobiopterin dehydratase [Deltaproteobacteria bacterium]
MKTCDLSQKNCKPCEGGVPALSKDTVTMNLSKLNGWKLENGKIAKTFKFKDYYRTMAFVNATAWISNKENHHPDLEVSYGSCRVSYITHAINGLSENDFICAAKIDALMAL